MTKAEQWLGRMGFIMVIVGLMGLASMTEAGDYSGWKPQGDNAILVCDRYSDNPQGFGAYYRNGQPVWITINGGHRVYLKYHQSWLDNGYGAWTDGNEWADERTTVSLDTDGTLSIDITYGVYEKQKDWLGREKVVTVEKNFYYYGHDCGWAIVK